MNRLLHRAFAVGSISWAAMLPIATFVASRPVESGASLFAAAIYLVGSLVCHQRSERSFHLWAHQMPVCARCTGIYTGAALTVLVWPAARRVWPSARTFARSPKLLALLACAPAAATLVYEWTTDVMPSNWIRAASGLCLGAAVAVLVQRELH